MKHKHQQQRGAKRTAGSGNNRNNNNNTNTNKMKFERKRGGPHTQQESFQQKNPSSSSMNRSSDSNASSKPANNVLQQVLHGNKGQQMISQRRIEFHLATKAETSFAGAQDDAILGKYLSNTGKSTGGDSNKKFPTDSVDKGKSKSSKHSEKEKLGDGSNGDTEFIKLPNPGLFEPSIVPQYIKWAQVARVGPGFYNNGNSCFLNSTLQCLLHTPALAQVLMNDSKAALKSLSGRDGQYVSNDFQKLIADTRGPSGKSKALLPDTMLRNLRRVGKQFHNRRQEDAHEYLIQLLDCMREEVMKANGVKTADGKIADTTFVSRVFGGYLCNQLKCPDCQYASRTFNHFLDLSLELTKGVSSVDTAIQTFTKPETLSAGNEWSCDGCKRKVKAVKQMTIHKAPPVLVCHLKRFSFGNMFGKNKKRVDFTPRLSLSCDVPKQRALQYDLHGVIVHEGSSSNSGHYVAFIKAPNEQWYEFDDDSVSKVSLKTVLAQQAYILFYSLSGAPEASTAVNRNVKASNTSAVSEDKPTVTKVNEAADASSIIVETIARTTTPVAIKPVIHPPLLTSDKTVNVLQARPKKTSKPTLPTDASDSAELQEGSVVVASMPVEVVIDDYNTRPIRLRRKSLRQSSISPLRRKARQQACYNDDSSDSESQSDNDTPVAHRKRSKPDSPLDDDTDADAVGTSDMATVVGSTTAAPRPAIVTTSENVAKQLIKQSNRTKSTSGEGAWEDVDESLLRKAHRAGQDFDRETQSLLASRQTSEHDKLLDQGRKKKVKAKPDPNDVVVNAMKIENPFQQVQDGRNRDKNQKPRF